MLFVAPSGAFRVGLRIYFVIVLLLTSLLGDRCCHLRVKLELLRGQRVNITHMTGWLRGFSSLKVITQIRRLPAGWMGFLMVFAAILAILSDLLVSALVRTAPRASFCLFEQGLVINSSYASRYPNINGNAFLWASNAQLTSLNNADGWFGIYAKADNNTDFRATEQDTLGWWNCSQTDTILAYSLNMNDVDVVTDLTNRGLMYSNAEYDHIHFQDQDNGTQLIALSASTAGVGEAFDIKAAVDIYDDFSANTKTMTTYDCIVQGDQSGIITGEEGILSQINITWVIRQSAAAVQGNLYTGQDATTSVEDPGLWLNWILNSLVMVSGGHQSVSSPPPSSNLTDQFQGCLVGGTDVPPIVILVWFLVTFLFIFMIFYTARLLFQIQNAKSVYDANNQGGATSQEICDHTPNGLVDWMRHAVHESEAPIGPGPAGTHAKHHHLMKWLFSGTHQGQRLGIVSKEAAPPLESSPTSPEAFPYGEKGYAGVHQTEIIE